MSRPTLEPRALNRALLARQLLLARARLPVPRALERVGGLQTQYAPTGYVGLWSRLDGFRRADLTRALERRTAVQGTVMRVTIHTVSAADYWPFVAGVRRARRDWWRRSHKAVPVQRIEAAAEAVRARLGDGVWDRNELLEVAGDAAVANGLGLWVDLVRAPPSGTWERRRADLYALAERWLPPAEATEEDGVDRLVRRYLGGFGPARAADAAAWAGLPVTDVRRALERLPLRRFRDDEGHELVDLARAPLPPADAPAPVRFLGVWEALLLVHARRKGVLSEELRPRIFDTKTPHSLATFLVDGAVAGTWRVERARDRATLLLSSFAPLPRAVRGEVEREGEALLRWHEDDATSAVVSWRGEPA